jgi:hypothetical protein
MTFRRQNGNACQDQYRAWQDGKKQTEHAEYQQAPADHENNISIGLPGHGGVPNLLSFVALDSDSGYPSVASEAVVNPGKDQSSDPAVDDTVPCTHQHVQEMARIVVPGVDRADSLKKTCAVGRGCKVYQTYAKDSACPDDRSCKRQGLNRESHRVPPHCLMLKNFPIVLLPVPFFTSVTWRAQE